MPSKPEITKDTIQVAVESGADRIGRIAGIVTRAVRDITHEIGEWATDLFEITEAGKRANRDRRDDQDG